MVLHDRFSTRDAPVTLTKSIQWFFNFRAGRSSAVVDARAEQLPSAFVIRQIMSLSPIDSHREQNGRMREREIACAVPEDSPNRRKIESLARRQVN